MTVQFVTIPRSGHHLLVRLLQRARPRATYCEYYRPTDCCRSIPCTKGVDFQKSHDFRLDDPIGKNRKYIIQARNFWESIVSHWEFEIADRPAWRRGPDASWNFRRFARRQMAYRLAFTEKWINNPPPQSLVIWYPDLVADPVGTVDRVCHFVWGERAAPFTPEPMKPGRSVEAFRHYDKRFFASLPEN